MGGSAWWGRVGASPWRTSGEERAEVTTPQHRPYSMRHAQYSCPQRPGFLHGQESFPDSLKLNASTSPTPTEHYLWSCPPVLVAPQEHPVCRAVSPGGGAVVSQQAARPHTPPSCTSPFLAVGAPIHCE